MINAMARPRLPAAPDGARIVGLLMERMSDFPARGEVHHSPLTEEGRVLNEMRAAVSVGSLAAFVDALLYCVERRIAPPLWVPVAAVSFATGWTQRKAQWQRGVLVKRARYEAVRHLVNLRAEAGHSPYGALAAYLAEDRRKRDDLQLWQRTKGLSHARVTAALAAQRAADPIVPAPDGPTYEVASRMLQPTGARGASSTIRKDYEEVRASLNQGNAAAFYFPALPESLELIGSPDLIGSCSVPAPTGADEAEEFRGTGENSKVGGGAEILRSDEVRG